MKPYGRYKKYRNPCKKDFHPRPKKIWINWWENEIDFLFRTTIKRLWKKEIKEELELWKK